MKSYNPGPIGYHFRYDGNDEWMEFTTFEIKEFKNYLNGVSSIDFNTKNSHTKVTFAGSHIIIPQYMDGKEAGKQIVSFLLNQERKQKLAAI